MIKRLLRNCLHRLGYDLVRYEMSKPVTAAELDSLSDLVEEERKIVARVKTFTLTSVPRIATLLNAVHYISASKIPGDIAECGVWRGGSMMAVALALQAHLDTGRDLYLYDTFEGMSEPTRHDRSHDGVAAERQLDETARGTGVWCRATLEDVRANMLSTGYPGERIHLIKGKVEDTIPGTLPRQLALLRLDTDWYESTKHELTHLFPLLHPNGVLLLDDYGHWLGARKAVDEYFSEKNLNVFLHRIDTTGRLLVKGEALAAVNSRTPSHEVAR
jgi:hypothetical protein